jgi:hypothetical protein
MGVAVELVRRAGVGIVCRWMDILWCGCRWGRTAASLDILEQGQPLLDVGVVRVKFQSTDVCVDRVVDLVVARLVQCAEIVPNLADVWVKADRTRVGIQSVSVLIDLIVKNADGAPEGRIATVTIDCLLIRLIRLVVLLASHESATQEVPTLGIGTIRLERLCEISHRLILIGKGSIALVVQPPKLLQHLGMVRLLVQHPHVRVSRRSKLHVSMSCSIEFTHVLLQLVYVSDLEPDVPRCQRRRRITENVFEALKRQPLGEVLLSITHIETGGVLVLLFVDDAEAEINLISLVKICGVRTAS